MVLMDIAWILSTKGWGTVTDVPQQQILSDRIYTDGYYILVFNKS